MSKVRGRRTTIYREKDLNKKEPLNRDRDVTDLPFSQFFSDFAYFVRI
jgi:hypothetical protein